MPALNLKLVCVAMVCMLLADLKPTAALSCGDVNGQLLPCVGYVTSKKNDASPSVGCCNGVRNLIDRTSKSGKADRQMACNCLKQVASNARALFNPVLAEKLPNKCNVRIPYKISTSTDCNKVK